MIDVILWLTLGSLFFGQYLLSRFGPSWAGSILTALWVIAIILVAVNGHMSSWRDYLMATIGFLVLLVLWGRGIDARRQKIARETDRIDNTLGN